MVQNHSNFQGKGPLTDALTRRRRGKPIRAAEALIDFPDDQSFFAIFAADALRAIANNKKTKGMIADGRCIGMLATVISITGTA